MTCGDSLRGSSRKAVIPRKNSQHSRENAASCGESAVFYRAAGDPGRQNSQHHRRSAASCRDSAVFYRSAGAPGWAGAAGVRQEPPGTLSGPRRGSFSQKCSRPPQNQGNKAIFRRRARSDLMKRGLDRGRETISSGGLAEYHDVSRAYRQAPRVRCVNYYINCTVG